MTKAFWQAKIWGLLHDPALKALRHSYRMGDEGPWRSLDCMDGWQSPKGTSTHPQTSYSSAWLKYIGLCDLIAASSDRTSIGRLPSEFSAVTYKSEGLQIRHLLSGKERMLQVENWHDELDSSARQSLIEEKEAIPETVRQWTDARKVFWWLWRCYPQILSDAAPETQVLPAETRMPDASLWSHTNMTSVLAGSLAGYFENQEDYPQKKQRFKRSRPHIATFTFSPVQELIKASRKMRDFWAGSWLLHYLSAKACWDIAWKFGPDTMLYPCLYAQPLIDYWLLEKYEDFCEWLVLPSPQQLLTSGFPNIIVAILPDNGLGKEDEANPVYKVMNNYPKNSLQEEWLRIGRETLADLQQRHSIWRDISRKTWDGWLKSQWQTYWAAMPIGDYNSDLHHSPRDRQKYEAWTKAQNEFAKPKQEQFIPAEKKFLDTIFVDPSNPLVDEVEIDEITSELKLDFRSGQPNMNVGSWWSSIFDSLRFNLNAVKNARNWELPTAYGPRSTISGIGSVVCLQSEKGDWATERETASFWDNQLGMFDGIEELNATEVVKRSLRNILSKALLPNVPAKWRESLYAPDLNSGVAGWLRYLERQNNDKSQESIQYYLNSCELVLDDFQWAGSTAAESWGIPWIETKHPNWHNPRLLNAGWLIDEYPQSNNLEKRTSEIKELKKCINSSFAEGNNPTDWYALAAGDGDGMGDWLKGKHLGNYSEYIPDALAIKLEVMPSPIKGAFEDFLNVQKRMGPSTHSALSRALLDFSNQLVPYLTEQRYAGRLIYGGGDDVLAYTNLWEWDQWLWDIRQCFKGQSDPHGEFDDSGDYWQWKGDDSKSKGLSKRPLFTMGSIATISFGIVIAHHSVPLAIALEHMWEAEKEGAKKHRSPDGTLKDAVQVRVIYGNGNVLKATCKFATFNLWQKLLEIPKLEPAIFEQAATVWEQHPVPIEEAIASWCVAFCDRREKLTDNKERFRDVLTQLLQELWKTTQEKDRDREVKNWLKLAAFMLRKRDIKINCQEK
jgi:CRISPR-associated protein Cmr2